MCGNTDAPAGKHPDEPNVVGTAIEVDRDEHADHQHENTEVNNEGPHGWILAQAAAAAALDELGARCAATRSLQWASRSVRALSMVC